MNIDLQTIAMSLLALFGAILGWLGRELWTAVQKLRVDLSSLEIRISSDYVRYDRLQDAMRPVMEALHDIRDRLDSKVDK
jgi:hypothetical protein